MKSGSHEKFNAVIHLQNMNASWGKKTSYNIQSTQELCSF